MIIRSLNLAFCCVLVPVDGLVLFIPAGRDLDDKGWDFLIFWNHDESHRAGIGIDKMIALSSDIPAAGSFENLDLDLIRRRPDR
jgi:hypothetical protein